MSDHKPRRDDASTTASTSALSTVSELMEERRRLETWLQALEARRAETPKHVFTRVHADYSARLDAVIHRLTTHAEGMRTALTALTTRLAHLDEQQHRARDERSEAELRAHVGEITQEEWQRIKTASDEEIADLAKKHAETAAELERTKALVADAERPATPPEPASPVKPDTRHQVKAPEPRGPSRPAPAPKPAAKPSPKPAAAEPPDTAEGDLHVPAAERGTGAPAGDAGDFDELAFLHSVVDSPPNGAAKEPAAPPPAPPRPAPRPAPVAPPAPAPQRAAPPQPAAPKAADDLTVNRVEPVSPKIVPKGSGLAANVSGNNPVILKDKAADSGKTLKCAECGALNYATEWYCERCGAELASL